VLFLEYLGLFLRMMSDSPPGSPLGSIVRNVMLVVVYTLLSLPLVYAIAAIVASHSGDLLLLQRFRRRSGLVLAIGLTLVLGINAAMHTPYNETWLPEARISQSSTLGADSGVVTLSSAEYLAGVRATIDGADTLLAGRITHAVLRTGHSVAIPWLSIEETTLVARHEGDSLVALAHTLVMANARRPLQVTVAYRSDRPFTLTSPWTAGGPRRMGMDSDKLKTFCWYAFPDSTLILPVTFAVADSQRIRESIEVVYDSLAVPVTLTREGMIFTQRATVSAAREFGVYAK